MSDKFPWYKYFTERQVKEIEFCLKYANEFGHGTDGHNARIIIAEMAVMLNKIHLALEGWPDESIKEIMGFEEKSDEL